MIIIKYRKPLYHTSFPWTEERPTAEKALAFIEKLGPEYECLVFAMISKAELKKRAGKGGKK